MNIGERGLQLIKRFESCKLKAYQDQGGILTIGWGHTGPEVREGQTITQKEADRLLQQDINATVYAVNIALEPVKMHEWMWDAVYCFTYNVGIGAFSGSSMYDFLVRDMWEDAAEEFANWNKVKGKTNRGLTNRRKAEEELFRQGMLQLQVKGPK